MVFLLIITALSTPTVQLGVKRLVHQGAKYCWGDSKAKGHQHNLEGTISGAQIVFALSSLVVSTFFFPSFLYEPLLMLA